MASLKKIGKQLKSINNIYIFAFNLLNASVLKAEILLRQCKEYYKQKELCNFITEDDFERPSINVACGAENIFSGEFNKIIETEHQIKMGDTIKGISYEFSNEVCKYNFQYMDFHSNTKTIINMHSQIKKIDKYPYEIIKDSRYKTVVEKICYNYILSKIRYHEQMFRTKFMNNLVINCRKRKLKTKSLYCKARSIKITNDVLLVNNNLRK